MPHHASSDRPETCTGLRAKNTAGDLEPDLDRLAKLCADGQIPFPTNLSAVHRRKLLTQVNCLRRDRLLNHIANVIASDIFDRSVDREKHNAQKTL